jgi:hypothetical protein
MAMSAMRPLLHLPPTVAVVTSPLVDSDVGIATGLSQLAGEYDDDDDGHLVTTDDREPLADGDWYDETGPNGDCATPALIKAFAISAALILGFIGGSHWLMTIA